MYPLMAASLEKHARAACRAGRRRAAVFLPNGRPPQAGEVFRQTDLARLAAIHGRRGEGGRAHAAARPGSKRRATPSTAATSPGRSSRFIKRAGRAAVGRGPRRVPLAGRPARAPPLRRSRSLHLRRLVPGPGRCCRPWRCSKAPTSRRSATTAPITSTADRGAEARLRRPRGLLRRPGASSTCRCRP